MSADDDETIADMISQAEAFNELYAPSARKLPLLIRCYIGATNGGQSDRFRAAARNVVKSTSGKVKIEILSSSQIRKVADYTETHLAMWLLQSHCHFVITHVHQGTESFEWPVANIYATLFSTLYCHEGFPYGPLLRCPVFTQDKYEYLRRFPDSLTLPTLKIPMFKGSMEDVELYKVETMVKDFMKGQSADQKYIVKAPFVTNKQHYQSHASSFESIMTALNAVYADQHVKISRRKCYEIPYMMLQCRVPDSTEPKLAFIGGQFSHFCGHRKGTAGSRGVIKSLPSHSQQDIIAFAETVVTIMQHFDDLKVILDGLIRVDLFDDGKGKLVVNEIESLEAAYNVTDEEANNRVQTFLDQYWEKKIYDSINNLL